MEARDFIISAKKCYTERTKELQIESAVSKIAQSIVAFRVKNVRSLIKLSNRNILYPGDSDVLMDELYQQSEMMDIILADYGLLKTSSGYFESEVLISKLRKIKRVLHSSGYLFLYVPKQLESRYNGIVEQVFKTSFIKASVKTTRAVGGGDDYIFIIPGRITESLKLQDDLLREYKGVLAWCTLLNDKYYTFVDKQLYTPKTKPLEEEVLLFNRNVSLDNLHAYTILYKLSDGTIQLKKDFNYKKFYKMPFTVESAVQCWKKSVEEYEAEGYVVIRPDWSGKRKVLCGFSRTYIDMKKRFDSGEFVIENLDGVYKVKKLVELDTVSRNLLKKQEPLEEGKVYCREIVHKLDVLKKNALQLPFNRNTTSGILDIANMSKLDVSDGFISRSADTYKALAEYVSQSKKLKVLDCTAGLGSALLGMKSVLGDMMSFIACEKEASVYELLKENMELSCGECLEIEDFEQSIDEGYTKDVEAKFVYKKAVSSMNSNKDEYFCVDDVINNVNTALDNYTKMDALYSNSHYYDELCITLETHKLNPVELLQSIK